MMKRLPLPIWLLFRTNIVKTILFNFRMFPLKIARKLPIVFMGRVNTHDCTGSIVFTDPIYTGMVIVGEMPDEICPYKRSYPMRFKVAGKLEVGGHVHIRGGGTFNVAKKGTLTIGRYTLINCYTRIWCTNAINIGKNVRISWESQLFDSNFHYIVDKDGYTKDCRGKVIIGDNVWIGNRVTINKGTVLPNFSIVGSGSFVNKDFSEFGERTMVAGSPAKFIKSGYRRLFNVPKQMELIEYFNSNPELDKAFVGEEFI